MKARQAADTQPVAGPSTSGHYRTRPHNPITSSSATRPPPKPRNSKSTTNADAQSVSEPTQQARPKPRPVAKPSKGKGKAPEEIEVAPEPAPIDEGPLDENQTGSKRSTPPTVLDSESAPAAKKRKTADPRDEDDGSITGQ